MGILNFSMVKFINILLVLSNACLVNPYILQYHNILFLKHFTDLPFSFICFVYGELIFINETAYILPVSPGAFINLYFAHLSVMLDLI